MGEPEPLIRGDYDRGAFGPTILLKLGSIEAVQWLHDCVVKVRDGSVPEINLAAAPEVSIRSVKRLVLRLIEEPRERALTGPAEVVDQAEFDWAQDAGGWRFTAGLIEAFLSGRTGHQYLTQEGQDAALIEVSYGEPMVRIPDV